MNNDCVIGREVFLTLPPEEIRRVVSEKKKPKVGIFVAGGNRRLVMCRTRPAPTSDEPYTENTRFVDSLKEPLSKFYQRYKRAIVGIGPKIDGFCVPNLMSEKKSEKK